jgi:hypothetical protein
MATTSGTPKRQFERRLSALRDERAQWLAHWTDLSELIVPRRGRFLRNQSDDANKGDKRNGKIIDPTGTLAARTLASGMMAGITSPARPWFKLQTPDLEMMDYGPVRSWLDQVQNRLMTVFARSNLYNVLPVVYEELGVFGTGAMVLLEDDEDIIRCYPLTVGEYMVANSPRLVVDTLYRELQLTVGQLVSEYGLDRVTASTRQMHETGAVDRWVNVVHVIEPNDQRLANTPGARGMRWRSVHYEAGCGDDEYLRVSGFEEFPAMVPRWHVTGTDVYGRSPGMEALPDIRQLQVMAKRKGQAIDKMVNPPMIAPSSLRQQAASILPGAITYVDMAAASGGQPAFRPAYEVNPRVGELMADIQAKQNDVKSAFYADLFLMLANSDRRQITAREIDERHEEKLLMLGPVLERLHDELLDPLIDRTVAIMARGQLLPPAPPELQGVELRVEYISMLAQAQRAVGTSSIRDYATFAIGLAGANPDVLDKVDFDKAVDNYGMMIGVPSDLIRTDDQVAEIRAQKARQAQQAQAMQMTAAAADTAQTMANTPIGDQNGLERVLAGMGVPA